MALEQRYMTDEVARKDTKMARNCDSDGEKCKYNSKIPPWICLLPQYVKRRGGGSGTRVSQCHGIFQSLCSGFM